MFKIVVFTVLLAIGYWELQPDDLEDIVFSALEELEPIVMAIHELWDKFNNQNLV